MFRVDVPDREAALVVAKALLALGPMDDAPESVCQSRNRMASQILDQLEGKAEVDRERETAQRVLKLVRAEYRRWVDADPQWYVDTGLLSGSDRDHAESFYRICSAARISRLMEEKHEG